MKLSLTNLFIFMAFTVHAQQAPQNFSLEQAVQYALEHNIDLGKSKIDRDIVDAQIAEVKGRAMPQINANAGFTDNFSLAEQQLPAEFFGGEPGTTIGVTFGNQYSLTGGFNVQQELVNFQLISSIRGVKALQELQNLQILQTTEDLVINVIQVYIQIQVTEKQIEILEDNYARTNSLVELSELKYKEGIIKKLDLNQLIVNRTNLVTQIEDAKYNHGEQLRLLKLYLNLSMDTEVFLTERLEDTPPYPFQEGLDIESNIEYQRSQQQLDLSVLDQKLIKAESLPSLQAFFNYNYLGNTNEFKFSGDKYNSQWNGTWGLSLSVPVFSGLQRSKRLQQKELETRKLKEDNKGLLNTIEKSYLDAYDQLSVSNIQIINQQKNMELAHENYDGIKLSYTDGVAPLTELLDSEFALRQSQSNYLNAILQYKVAELRLLKASGQLSQLISVNETF